MAAAAVVDDSLDVRVEDFLDDRLQSTADLNALDGLVASVETQRAQLQDQLKKAERALVDVRRSTSDRYETLRDRIREFHELQQSIDVRAARNAASDAPDEAIERLQLPMEKLRAVRLAHDYLALLQRVEALRAEARAHLPASPKAALEPYSSLKELAAGMRAVPDSEGLHLVDHVDAVAHRLWVDMKSTMSAELDTVLVQRHWPRVDPQSSMDDDWIACAEKLLDLQMPELLHGPPLVSLLPFDAMAAIFVAEFRFHFLSNKPTSSLQAVTTHCFPWFLTTLDKWDAYFRDNLAPLLSVKFGDGPLADKAVYLDPACALVTAMLPVMQEKVDAVAAEAIQNPAFLSSFLSQLMGLDGEIRARYGYDGGDPDLGWPGLSASVLDRHFDAWLRVERDFALERFHAIMESPDARKIDYDYAAHGRMKPTVAAVRILDLLRAITSKYERLRKLHHKIRFLTDIQLDILDAYHDRLRGSLEAYQSMTSTLGRTLHGASREQLAALEGTGALESLCKVAGSAYRVAVTLSEWSDDEFFVTLWQDIQARDARRRSGTETGHEALKGRVPPLHSSSEAEGAKGDEESGIFDETVAAFEARRRAAEDLLTGALADSHSKAFAAYLGQTQWTTVGETAVLDDASQMSVTPELDEPLCVMRRNLEMTARALSSASLRRVWHGALDRLQDALWSGVLVRHSFTALGAAQLAHDVAALTGLIDQFLPCGGGGGGVLAALCDGTRLLNLPVSSTASASTSSTTATGTAAEDPAADGAASSSVSGSWSAPLSSAMTLKEATDRAFTSNDEARAVLETLGLEALTPANARHILERRVENGESVGW